MRPGCAPATSRFAPTVRAGWSSFMYDVPITVAWPDVGRASARIIRSVVVLPAPFGPRNPVTAPSRTENDRWSTATTPPYRLVSSTVSIAATAAQTSEHCRATNVSRRAYRRAARSGAR